MTLNNAIFFRKLRKRDSRQLQRRTDGRVAEGVVAPVGRSRIDFNGFTERFVGVVCRFIVGVLSEIEFIVDEIWNRLPLLRFRQMAEPVVLQLSLLPERLQIWQTLRFVKGYVGLGKFLEIDQHSFERGDRVVLIDE